MKLERRPNITASVVDLFCGAGGLSYGFKEQSFHLAAGIDIDEACRYPYEANNKAPFLRKMWEGLFPQTSKRYLYPVGSAFLLAALHASRFRSITRKTWIPIGDS